MSDVLVSTIGSCKAQTENNFGEDFDEIEQVLGVTKRSSKPL